MMNNANANLEQRALALARDFRAAGYTVVQAMEMLQRTLNAGYGIRLTAHELEALTHPVGRGNAEIIEKIEADCLTEQEFNMNPGDKTHLSIDPLAPRSYRNPSTIYASDMTKAEFFHHTEQIAFLKNASDHNAGYDFVAVTEYIPEDGDVCFRLCQQKVGETPLNDGNSEKGANRSARFISQKLIEAAGVLEERMEKLYDVRASIGLEVHSLSPVRATARQRFQRNQIELFDATRIWDEVWTDEVKQNLLKIHGPRRAKGLGTVL